MLPISLQPFIDSNLFANAVGSYVPNAINKVNANWGLGWLHKQIDCNVIYIKTMKT